MTYNCKVVKCMDSVYLCKTKDDWSDVLFFSFPDVPFEITKTIAYSGFHVILQFS